MASKVVVRDTSPDIDKIQTLETITFQKLKHISLNSISLSYNNNLYDL